MSEQPGCENYLLVEDGGSARRNAGMCNVSVSEESKVTKQLSYSKFAGTLSDVVCQSPANEISNSLSTPITEKSVKELFPVNSSNFKETLSCCYTNDILSSDTEINPVSTILYGDSNHRTEQQLYFKLMHDNEVIKNTENKNQETMSPPSSILRLTSALNLQESEQFEATICKSPINVFKLRRTNTTDKVRSSGTATQLGNEIKRRANGSKVNEKGSDCFQESEAQVATNAIRNTNIGQRVSVEGRYRYHNIQQSNALPSPESVDSGYGDHNEGMWSASGRAATSSYHGQRYHPFQQQTPSYPSMQNILNYEKMGHGVMADHGDHNGTFYSSPECQYDSYHGLNEEHDAYFNYNSRSSTSDYHALLSPSESFGDRIPPVCFPSHHEKAEHRQRHAVYLSQSLQRRSNFPQNTDLFDNGESELGISAREAQSVLTEIGSYHPHTITSYERMREHHPIVPLQHDVKSIVSVQNLTGVHSYEAGHSLPRQNCKRILEKAHQYEDSHIHFAPSQIFNMPSDKYDSRSRVNVSPEISNRQPTVYSQEQIDLANRASSSHQHPSDYVMANGLQYVSVSPSIESNQSQYSNRSYSLPKTPTPAPNVDYFDSLMPGLNNNKIPSKQVSDEIQLYHRPISNIKVENTSNRSRSYNLYLNKGCANTSSRNSHVHPQANPIIPIQDLTGYTGNGPIQLWQFLLELLCDPTYQNLITWTGENWQFKMIDPDEVARGWGIRKNKPKMTYEKLSRGIRYYYDKNIIVKCTGRRYVYKFVNDLDKILGHSAIQLHKMLGITPLDEESTTESNDEASKSQNQNSPKVSKSETTSKHNTSLNNDQHQAARSHVVRDAMAPTSETEQTGVLRTRSRSALPSHGPSTSPSIRKACDKQSIQRQFSLPAGSTHYPTTPLSPNESETGLKRMSFQTNIVMSEYLPKKSYTVTSNENNSSIISTLTSSTSL